LDPVVAVVSNVEIAAGSSRDPTGGYEFGVAVAFAPELGDVFLAGVELLDSVVGVVRDVDVAA